MVGRRVVIGLSLLSALLFCGFAVQSASAAETESANTTAFTCVVSGGETNKDFKDEHCDERVEPGKGNFEHLKIPNGTGTRLGGNNEKVTELTKNLESVIIRGKIGLTAIEITCEKFVIDENNSFIENTEPAAKDHKVKGTVRAELTKCIVKKPLKCTVSEPIVMEATFVGVDGLKDPVTGKENAMGLRFTGEKDFEGKKDTLMSITFTGPECPLKEKTFPLTGSFIATAGPGTEADQENKHHGATWVVTPKFEMQKLHLGAEPNKAELETIITPRMAEQGNPITLTTTT